ncbi:hypothetical protein Hdeb2414_s0146g00813231 [Helianthus debilis subsp. tardiflorus]
MNDGRRMSEMMDGSGGGRGRAISLSTLNGAGSGEDDTEVLYFFQSWCLFSFLNGVIFFSKWCYFVSEWCYFVSEWCYFLLLNGAIFIY